MTVRQQDQAALERLPKWAQDHINNLSSALKVSEKALKDYTDSTTPSPFEVLDIVCLTKTTPVRRYVQASSMIVRAGGVRVDVYPQDDGINILFEGDRKVDDVALVPQAGNSINIRRVTYPEKK